MYMFSNPSIKAATISDAPHLAHLLNKAYRGESSKQGWTTEANLIAGNTRTDDENVRQLMQQPDSIFLKYFSSTGEITGCVNLQKHGEKLYLGMLSVEPHLQGFGIGKHLLRAAEEYALSQNCTSIYMTVITARTELIEWYSRFGYVDTGTRKDFKEDALTGKPLQQLEFMVLEKHLHA